MSGIVVVECYGCWLVFVSGYASRCRIRRRGEVAASVVKRSFFGVVVVFCSFPYLWICRPDLIADNVESSG